MLYETILRHQVHKKALRLCSRHIVETLLIYIYIFTFTIYNQQIFISIFISILFIIGMIYPVLLSKELMKNLVYYCTH